MSLPQLVGRKCVACQNHIGSITEARFCGACGNPIHDKCLEFGNIVLGEGKCPDCGGDIRSEIAREVQSERKRNAGRPASERGPWSGDRTVPAAVTPRVSHPISRVCPKCGSTEYKKRKPEAWVAFVWDRVCKSCETRYTPPTPVWAAMIFIFAGLILGGYAVLSLLGGLVHSPLAALGVVCYGPLGLMGILALVYGFRCLLKTGSD